MADKSKKQRAKSKGQKDSRTIEELEKKVEDLERQLNRENSLKAAEDEPGIPSHLRIKRHYTLTEDACNQRRKAAKSSKKRDSMKGNKNAWKHGKYTKNFVDSFIRPCKSTCNNYPCEIVREGGTKPGNDCLDKAEILENFRALQDAIKHKQYDDINEIMALKVAEAMKVVDMLIEDVIRDNTMCKSEKFDAFGRVIGYEIRSHPSLHMLPKMLEKLGLTLHDLHVTPKALEKQKGEEKREKSLSEILSNIGGSFKKDKEE